MPIYEYRCAQCGRKESKFWRSLSSVDEAQLACSKCGSPRMGRLVSRVRVVRGGGGGSDNEAAPGPDGDLDASLMREMESLDESDPRALGRFMRKMAAQTGEELGDEFNEVVGRLEKGEDPDKIEQNMGDLFGAADGAGDMNGMNGMNGMSGMNESEPAQPSDSEPKTEKPGRSRRSKTASPKPAGRTAQKVKSSPKAKRKQ